jgi:hypothetical protein
VASDLMDERRCRAISKRSGERCRRFPAPGGVVCHFHGGATKAAKAAAKRRVAEAQAEALLKVIWDPDAAPVEDTLTAMKKLAGQLTHAVDVLGGRLAGDQLDDATSVAWGRVLRELRQLLVAMERLGIEQRLVELEAAKVRMVATALQAALDGWGLSPVERDRFLRSFLDRLRVQESAAETVRGELV